jgi:hypothetical protein
MKYPFKILSPLTNMDLLYSFRNGSWSWSSGRDNLEVYLRMAEKHRADGDQVALLT